MFVLEDPGKKQTEEERRLHAFRVKTYLGTYASHARLRTGTSSSALTSASEASTWSTVAAKSCRLRARESSPGQFDDKDSAIDWALMLRSRSSPVARSIATVDPFSSFAVKLDHRALDILRFARSQFIPQNYRGELLVTGQSPLHHRDNQTAQRRIQACILGDAVDIYGLLTAAGTLRALETASTTHQNLVYADQALRLLRAQLSADLARGGAKGVVVAIYNLAYAECSLGNFNAARAHMHFLHAFFKNANTLIRPRDNDFIFGVALAAASGCEPLSTDPPWKPTPLPPDRVSALRIKLSELATIRQNQLRSAMTQGDPPLADAANTLLQTPLEPTINYKEDLAVMRHALSELFLPFHPICVPAATSLHFSEAFRTVLLEGLEPWLCLAAWCFYQEPGTVSLTDGQWVEMEALYLSHSLLILPKPSDLAKLYQDWMLEDSFRLVLITLLAQFSTLSQQVWRHSLPRIKISLSRLVNETVRVLDSQCPSTDTNESFKQRYAMQKQLSTWILHVCLTLSDTWPDYTWFLGLQQCLEQRFLNWDCVG